MRRQVIVQFCSPVCKRVEKLERNRLPVCLDRDFIFPRVLSIVHALDHDRHGRLDILPEQQIHQVDHVKRLLVKRLRCRVLLDSFQVVDDDHLHVKLLRASLQQSAPGAPAHLVAARLHGRREFPRQRVRAPRVEHLRRRPRRVNHVSRHETSARSEIFALILAAERDERRRDVRRPVPGVGVIRRGVISGQVYVRGLDGEARAVDAEELAPQPVADGQRRVPLVFAPGADDHALVVAVIGERRRGFRAGHRTVRIHDVLAVFGMQESVVPLSLESILAPERDELGGERGGMARRVHRGHLERA